MGSNTKAIVFDVGGVLFLAKNKRKEKNLLSSFKEVCLLLRKYGIDTSGVDAALFDIYKKSSRGGITKEETLKQMSEELGVSSRKLELLFRKLYCENTIENVVLYKHLLDLKGMGYKIGILSTQFHLSKDCLIPKKYYSKFDAISISSDDGCKKPGSKAFRLVLKRLKVKPEECIFVDDKQENLDAAQTLGMETIIFKNNRRFFKSLKESLSI